MALLELLTGPSSPRVIEHRTSLQGGDSWLIEMLGRGTQTSSGTWVTPETALRIAAVYRAVMVIAGGIAMSELPIYRRIMGGGKERSLDNPLYGLLHDSPNEAQTAFEFREQMTANALLNGNAYAEIDWRGDGVIRALNPLNPERVRPYRMKDGAVWYEFRPIQGETRQIAAEDMFHLKNFSRDGICGLSPIALMRETVGLAQASQEYQARFFSNDATPPLVLTTPQVLSKEAQDRLQQSWIEGGAGLPNAHRPRVLEQGLTATVVGVSNKDAEFLSLRNYSDVDIARIFGVPPHMIQNLDRATFANVEHLALEFVAFCLTPWARRWEQAISLRLMSAKMRAGYFAEFRMEKLIVTDVLNRYQAYNAAILSGWMNRNEPRENEGLNPQKGLDVFLEPMNAMPVGSQAPTPGKQPPAKSPMLNPSPAPDPEEENSMRAAFREMTIEKWNRIVRKEVTAVRRLVKKYPLESSISALTAEVAKFYKEFEGGEEHARESLRELRAAIVKGPENLEGLLADWEANRANLIVKKEMSQWEIQ